MAGCRGGLEGDWGVALSPLVVRIGTAKEVGLMTSPAEPDEGPNWAELEPNPLDQDQIGRQVRIMFAAGKDVAEVSRWLRQNGFSAVDAEAYLTAWLEATRQGSRGWRRG